MTKTINQDLDIGQSFVLVDKKKLTRAFTKVRSMENPELMVYRAVCWNNGIVGIACPNNSGGLCMIEHLDYPWDFMHEYDGKNCYKCPCG